MDNQQTSITKEAAAEQYKAIRSAVFSVVEFDEALEELREEKLRAMTALQTFRIERGTVRSADDLYDLLIETARLEAALAAVEALTESAGRALAAAIDTLHKLTDGLPVNAWTFNGFSYRVNGQEIWAVGRNEPISARRWVFDD